VPEESAFYSSLFSLAIVQFTTVSSVNGTAEVAAADGYPRIRVMTVGEGDTSYTPLNNLASIAQTWSVASAASIGVGNWSEFSAVCWFFGRDLFNGLGGTVPVGLISSNWGGTRIQAWSSPAALSSCNTSDALEAASAGGLPDAPAPLGGGPGPNNATVLYNAMILPFAVGPMAISGWTWFQVRLPPPFSPPLGPVEGFSRLRQPIALQGESNSGGAASTYACAQQAMIKDWRTIFNNPSAWFGFVLLEPVRRASPAPSSAADAARASIPTVRNAAPFFSVCALLFAVDLIQ